MSNDKILEAFEKQFPLPAAVFWNEFAEQYDALPECASLAEEWQAMFTGYKAALTQQPESESKRQFHEGALVVGGTRAGEYVLMPKELTREMWAAAGDAVVLLQIDGVGNHDKIIEAVWVNLKRSAPSIEESSAQVPEGWKLAPVKADMEAALRAARGHISPMKCAQIYEEMLQFTAASSIAEQTLAIPEAHSDNQAVDRFAAAMKQKLAISRDKGRSGWDDPEQCSVEFLQARLIEHMDKANPGNWVDLANFCMMLHERGADPIALIQAAQVPEGWRVENEPEHSMMTVFAPNGKAAILRDFDGSVGGMFIQFVRAAFAPSIEEKE